MPYLLGQLGRAIVKIGTILPLLFIFAGLALEGAATASLSALLAATLLLSLLLRLAFVDGDRLRSVLARYVLSAIAAICFLCWSGATALRFPVCQVPDVLQLVFHPTWREFGLSTEAVSISPYRTIEGIVAFLCPLSAFLLGALTVERARDRNRISGTIAVLTVAIAAYALSQHLHERAFGARLMLNFGSANSAACLFGALGILNLASVLRHQTHNDSDDPIVLSSLTRAPIAVTGLLLSLACLMLTASRGGILSALVGLSILVLMRTRFLSRPSFSTTAIASVICALFLIGGQFAIDRLTNLGPDAAMREQMAQTHWRAFLDRPWIGHGLNTFHELNLFYASPNAWPALHSIGSAHSIYIQLLEETGIVGAALFTLMLGPILFRVFLTATLSERRSASSAGAIAAFVAALMHGAVDFGLQTPAIAALLTYSLGAASAKL